MANIRYRNASEMSRVLMHGANLYAIRQDARIGSPEYSEADRKWTGWCELEPALVEHAMALQSRAFDIALRL